MVKVKVLNNTINKGWNVGDVVEVENPDKYGGYVEILETLNTAKQNKEANKPKVGFVKKVEREVKKVFKGKKVK